MQWQLCHQHLLFLSRGVQFCDQVHCSTCRAQYKEWLATYESLTQMVVPRSSQLIHEDTEYGLYSVSVFKKVIDEYKLHAREKK